MRGQAGYVDAEITITIQGSYWGAGVAGYNLFEGQEFKFCARVRESEFIRSRYDTTGEAFRSGITNSVGRRINLTIYYKGDDYPPDFESYEYVYFDIDLGSYRRRCVVLVEAFRNTGEVDRALEYTFSGETDGIFL